MAGWLDEVWQYLRLEKASIVGMSLGGWLGLDFAVRRPERVTSLSMLSPSGIGRQNYFSLLRIGVLRMCGDWGLRRSLQLVTGRVDALPRQVSDALVTVFRNFRPRMDRIPIRSDAELRALAMPVQLIVGERDALIRSGETRERMERLVTPLHLAFLENVGHILPSQTQTIAGFLETVNRCPRVVPLTATAETAAKRPDAGH